AWYGPNNAVLVLAGDIDLATARQKAARYFGHIPAGPRLERVSAGPARRATSHETMTDQVPQARIYRAWSVDRYGSADADYLAVLARVLGGSRSSRLDRRLVFEEKLADKVSAYVQPFELASTFYVTADVKQGVDPAKVEAVVAEDFARLLAHGPTAGELHQARTVITAQVLGRAEPIGGVGGKADALAGCAVYTGDPGCYRHSLPLIEEATVRDL